MKKTVLVSVITTIITVALIMFLVHMFSYCCNEGSCDYDHDTKCKKECEMKGELKALRAEFDQELSDEEKQLIKESKENLAEFDHDAEMATDAHEADFKALATIAENHKESLEAVKAKFHKMHSEKACCKPHEGCCKKDKSCCTKRKACCDKKMAHKCPEKKACCEKKDEHKCPEGEAAHKEAAEHKESAEHTSAEGEVAHKEAGEHKCPEYKSCGEKNCDHKTCGEKLAAHKSPEKKACCEKKKSHKCSDKDTFGIHFLLMEF